MLPNKKSSILLVLKVLEEYTDEEHYLTQQEIADKIYQVYDIELERKSVGSSLSMLEELDYDIDKGPKGGFALLSRTFDQTEASYLIDAIFSSRSIDGRQAKKIADQVSSCFSKYQRKDYSYIYKSSEINRTDNKQVLYNISVIHEAMKQGKRVGFQYLAYDAEGNQTVRRDGYEFIVSPYYLINNFGRYYLLCNYREKYRALQTFRIDYMVNIQIKDDWPIKNMNDLEEGPKDFSISKYLNDHIYMFGGDVIEAELELDGDWGILIVKDWFGENAKLSHKDGKAYIKVKCNEMALYYWIMQYSDCVKVISPASLIEKTKEGLQKALERYK
jgi:predicted DNA-binding transcriptional regulator YafY